MWVKYVYVAMYIHCSHIQFHMQTGMLAPLGALVIQYLMLKSMDNKAFIGVLYIAIYMYHCSKWVVTVAHC